MLFGRKGSVPSVRYDILVSFGTSLVGTIARGLTRSYFLLITPSLPSIFQSIGGAWLGRSPDNVLLHCVLAGHPPQRATQPGVSR